MLARIVCTGLLGCLLTAGAGSAEEINPLLGKVGDFSLREADLERLLANQPPAARKQLQDNPELKVGLVRELLAKKLIANQARKEGFDKKPEFKEQLSYLVDDLLAREYLLKVVTAGITVSDEELNKYYQAHEKEFLLPATAHARHIFVKAGRDASPETVEKARSKALAILDRLKKGEDFARLAGELSEDADTAAKGGDLGTISRGKTNSPEFETAVFALKAGDPGQVVESAFGFHVIRVDERKEQRTATLAEVREFIADRLRGELEQKKALEFLEKGAKEAGMEIFAERITGQKSEPPAAELGKQKQ